MIAEDGLKTINKCITVVSVVARARLLCVARVRLYGVLLRCVSSVLLGCVSTVCC